MIQTAFALSTLPFQPPRTHSELFPAAQVNDLLTRLERLRHHRGIALVTGETGAGKSTVTHVWLHSLPTNATLAITLVLPAAAPRALLRRLARHLAITPAHSYESLLSQVTDTLIAVRDQDKRQPILVVEEAQGLSLDCIEVLRHLADLRPDGHPLLAILLVAHRDFTAVLKQRVATAIRQRLLFTYHLTGMQRDEIAPYLEHQLARAGLKRPIFDADAISALFNLSKGLPRMVNALATDALYDAAARQLATIDRTLIERAAEHREDLA